MIDNLPNEQEPTPTPVKRPPGLTFICILTFVFSGLSFISSLFYSVYYNFLPGFIKSSPFSKTISGIEGMTEAIKTLTEANIWFFIFNTLLYGISLAGGILMFRLRRVGFHLYTVSQILLLITPLVYLAGYKTDIASTAITAIFIFLYYTNLRIMK
jgi:hypothetical protein